MTRANSPCSQFRLDFGYDVDAVRISLHGELDALSVPAFEGAVRALARRRPRSVTIDLSELRFCNVGGLRVMAELAAGVNEAKGRVEIVAPAILTRMLAISDLRSLFVVAEPDTARPSVTPPRTPRAAAPARSSRPRASSLHRLSTGT